MGGAAFAQILFERLGGATIADGSIRFAVEVAQVAEVANAAATAVMDRVGEGLSELSYLKGKTSGGSNRVSEDVSLTDTAEGDGLAFEFRLDAGFFAERERRSDLDARSAQLEGFGEFARMAITASEPEGQS